MKRKIHKVVELGICLTAVATLLLAGCSGGSSGSQTVSTTPLVVTPALGQVYSGQITVTGTNGTSRSYAIVSGVPSVTADIAGMTAPLLIALSGDPANGGELAFFDEGLGRIASAVVGSGTSAIRAIVPSVTDLPASGVGITPLTELAAATVSNTATGSVDIANLSIASAVGANTAGLALAQKLSGSTTLDDILAPPTSVNALGANLGSTASDIYAKVLHVLAKLPYGANALQIVEILRNDIIANGSLTGTFDADVAAANTAARFGYNGTPPVPVTANGDFLSIMDIAARALPDSTVSASRLKTAGLAMMDIAFNAASGIAPIDRNAPAYTAAIDAARTAATYHSSKSSNNVIYKHGDQMRYAAVGGYTHADGSKILITGGELILDVIDEGLINPLNGNIPVMTLVESQRYTAVTVNPQGEMSAPFPFESVVYRYYIQDPLTGTVQYQGDGLPEYDASYNPIYRTYWFETPRNYTQYLMPLHVFDAQHIVYLKKTVDGLHTHAGTVDTFVDSKQDVLTPIGTFDSFSMTFVDVDNDVDTYGNFISDRLQYVYPDIGIVKFFFNPTIPGDTGSFTLTLSSTNIPY